MPTRAPTICATASISRRRRGRSRRSPSACKSAISSRNPRLESPLIPSRFAACAFAVACATLPLAARADVTLGIGGAPAIGTYGDLDGTRALGGRPVPVADLDARFGSLELHGESVPYERTGYYGNPFDPSTAVLSTFGATLRAYEPGRRLAFGIGYGALLATTFRTEPASTLATEATGVRLELHDRIPVSERATLELTFGGEPDLRGTTRSTLGVVGAAALADPIAGAHLVASVVDVVAANRRLGFAYGVRYDNASLRFARSDALVERQARLLPFAQLRLRL